MKTYMNIAASLAIVIGILIGLGTNNVPLGLAAFAFSAMVFVALGAIIKLLQEIKDKKVK